MSYQYDLLVIGAGSGGVRAARTAAEYGAKVAICEDRYLGGTCVNVGCVPKKLYVYASAFNAEFQAAKGFGWDVTPPQFHWATLRDNKKQEISRLNDVYRGLLERADVTLLQGRGRLIDPHTVDVDGQHVTAERILIATGGWPHVPNIPGKEYALNSNQIFDLETFPTHITVVGGGYIATEFASIFNGLGAQVVQVIRSGGLLHHFDREIAEFAAEQVQQNGVTMQFNDEVTAIEKLADDRYQLTLKQGESITTNAVLFATGRKPHLADLGLDNIPLELTKSGHIAVNETFQTSVPSIYALGDVTGGIELTPVALEEASTLTGYLYNNKPCEIDYSNIATTVFCQPNIGTVGMTEEQAREKYPNILKFRANFRAMKNTLGGSPERTLMKLIVDADTDKVLGAHMVGENAGEIIQGIAIALKAGATKAQFDATIGIHPTAAEEFVTMRTPVSD